MTTIDLAPRPPSVLTRAGLWMKRHAISFYAAILTLLMALFAIAPSIFIEVPAGHVGVLWLRFFGGTVTDRVFKEGLHVIFPWDTVTLYDVRLRTDNRRFDAVTSNGMTLTVEVSVRYRVNPPTAGVLHKLTGPSFADTLVHPKVGSLVYHFVAQNNPESFYSADRADIQTYLMTNARNGFPVPSDAFDVAPGNLGEPMIRVEDVLVSGITLPPLVRQAIDRKIEQQQIMQEYEFRVAREAKERDRKRIEAEGIRDFQETVAHTITPEYLRLRGIEATRAFAESANAKTIIIGGRDGLPVILNTADDARPHVAPAAPAPFPPGATGEAAAPRPANGDPPANAPPSVPTPNLPSATPSTPAP
ncbi:prohibitin family protein [Azospirillum griseum]|uniref:Prohibitin family protein n=1 Tax=Azospirillum griseum TaxID=2496639 RepID=A0A3S0HXD0_9PROT|nr:prohibitin family protein [Azospirillum griseum]RTR15944.1 prohibitin family protein [Azospirillum griseum]